jgi:hypothetical protein
MEEAFISAGVPPINHWARSHTYYNSYALHAPRFLVAQRLIKCGSGKTPKSAAHLSYPRTNPTQIPSACSDTYLTRSRPSLAMLAESQGARRYASTSVLHPRLCDTVVLVHFQSHSCALESSIRWSTPMPWAWAWAWAWERTIREAERFPGGPAQPLKWRPYRPRARAAKHLHIPLLRTRRSIRSAENPNERIRRSPSASTVMPCDCGPPGRFTALTGWSTGSKQK